jgi:hypothetical protein
MTEKMRPTWTSFRRPASFDYPTGFYYPALNTARSFTLRFFTVRDVWWRFLGRDDDFGEKNIAWVLYFKLFNYSFTYFKNVFFFFFHLQVLTFRFLNMKSNVLSRKSTRSLIPCLQTQWLLPLNLPISSLHSPSWFEVLLFVATILLKIIVIQINVHSAYRVILRYWSWTPLVKLKTDERML